MSKIELLELLRQKQEECRMIIESKNEELQFYDTFFKRNNFNNVESIANIDLTAFLFAYLLPNLANTENKQEVYEYLKKDVLSLIEIVEQTPKEGLANLIEICERLKEFDAVRVARGLFAVPKRKLGRPSLEKFAIESIIEKDNLEKLYYVHDETKRNIGSFFDLYAQMETAFVNAINIIRDLKAIKEEYQRFQQRLSQIPFNSKERKIITSRFKNSYDFSQLRRHTDIIRAHYEKLTSIERSKKRNAQRDLNTYETLEKKIRELLTNNTEITDVANILSKVSEPEIRLSVLKLIYQHNQEYYEQLIKEYETLSNNSIISYKKILNDYGIVNADIKTIMHNPAEVVESILAKIKQLNITEELIIIKILQITDKDTFETIYGLIIHGQLTLDFATKNLLIFSKETIEYKNLIINVSLFKELGFNPNNLNNSQQIFISNPNTIATNIEILKIYGFEKNFKKDIDYSFLSNPNLMSIIDIMLELGLEKFLEEDLSILNYYKNINRLRVLKELNIEVETKEELIELLTTTSFLVPDNMIESYISTQNEDEIDIEGIPDDLEVLRDYQKTSRVYDINGVLLSKNRIKRNYHDLEGVENRLAKSIFKGAQISPKDYEIISKTLKESLTQK